jgi:hypothetical protein
MKYPHYFEIRDENDNFTKAIVIISSHTDMTTYNQDWMGEETIEAFGGRSDIVTVLQPDIDITQELHEFSSPENALNFIKNWWTQHNINYITS